MTEPIILRCYKPGLSPKEFIGRVQCGRKPKGLRYGTSGLNCGPRCVSVYADGAGALDVFADYGHFTVFPHHADGNAFARQFAEAWGGKRGRIVELTREDLEREYAEAYEEANAE